MTGIDPNFRVVLGFEPFLVFVRKECQPASHALSIRRPDGSFIRIQTGYVRMPELTIYIGEEEFSKIGDRVRRLWNGFLQQALFKQGFQCHVESYLHGCDRSDREVNMDFAHITLGPLLYTCDSLKAYLRERANSPDLMLASGFSEQALFCHPNQTLGIDLQSTISGVCTFEALAGHLERQGILMECSESNSVNLTTKDSVVYLQNWGEASIRFSLKQEGCVDTSQRPARASATGFQW